MVHLARCNLPQDGTSHSGRLQRQQFVKQCPDFEKLAPYLLQRRFQGLPRGNRNSRGTALIGHRI